MSGARFIWNTRYFHIAKPGEKLSDHALSGKHVSGLVKYCGTRESVALNITDEFKNQPATEKQVSTINDLLEELGFDMNDEDMPIEYDDYTKAPTKQNASELISRLSEILSMSSEKYSFDEAANLIEYAAKRPTAVRVGSHGLFSSFEDVNLENAMQEISTHEGNIWTHILSLKREDANALGYDSQAPWRNLVMSHIDEIAKAHKIKPENLRWYGAMHNTSYHPHIHLFVYSTDPKEGYFDRNDIKKIKSKFANDIFKDELQMVFEQKTHFRDELNQKSKIILNELLKNPEKSFENEALQNIANKMLKLSQSYKGSAKYGFQTKEVKALVNEIQSELVKNNPLLSELYTNWCNQQFNIEKVYLKNPVREYPIETNSTFNTIKNIIMLQAEKLRNNTYTCTQDNPKHTTENELMKDYPDRTFYSPKPENEEIKELQTPNFIFESDDKAVKDFKSLYILANDLSERDGEICRRLADCYKYGNGTQKDISEAVLWYGIAADQYQDSLASHRLGQLYTYGADGMETDRGLGEYYFKQAFFLFKDEIKNGEFFDELESGADELNYQLKVSKSEAYKEYLMGRMYLKGEGVEQSYFKAYQTFLLSAENGYAHANYYIGNQYYYGLGFEQNYNEAYSSYAKASARNDSYADYRIAKMHLKGEGVTPNIVTAEKYLLKSSDKVVLANYDLAKLYEDNSEIFNKSETVIFSLYSKALKGLLKQEQDIHDTFTETRIASMYLNGKGTEVNIENGIYWLEKLAEQGNPDAAYQLGYIYSSENYSVTDINKSNEYYKTALDGYKKAEKENTNATAEYRIGLIYLNALGVEKDIEQALHWFEKSALNGNASAAYKLAVIYEKGIETPQNTEKSFLYYQISAELGNPFAYYILGNTALEKSDVYTAIKNYKQAAENNISHAWYKLGQIHSDKKYDVFNSEQAQSYYKSALEQYKADYKEENNDFTAYRIGKMYLNAQGTEQNAKQAVEWFEKSAEQGNPDAAYQLGYIYRSEEYGCKNDTLSNKYFASALSSYLDNFTKNPADADLAMRIGTFYNYGLGVEHNINKAIEWYKKSVELGNRKAQTKIDNAQQSQHLSIMSVATTACHLGRMINTETMAAVKNRYASDKKLLRKEKIQKIYAGQAVDDKGQSYDY